MNSRWGPPSKSEQLISKLAQRTKHHNTPVAITRRSSKSHCKGLLARAGSAKPPSASRSSCRRLEQPILMLRRRAPRSSTVDAATQTGEEPVVRSAIGPCVECGRALRQPSEPAPFRAKAASVSPWAEIGSGERNLARAPGAERSHRNAQSPSVAALTGGAEERCPWTGPQSGFPGCLDRRTTNSAYLDSPQHDLSNSPNMCFSRVWSSSPTPLKNEDEDHPLLSPTGAKRNLQEFMAETREVLLEAVLATKRSPSSTPTRASLRSPFPVRPKSPPSRRSTSHSSASSYHALAVGGARAAVGAILDSLEEANDESDLLRPRDVRSYIINDQLGLLYERIEAKWSEVCNKAKADSDNKYNKFLAHWQCILGAQKDDLDREDLRDDIEAAWRRLTAELRDEFREACISFNEWRTSFVARDLRTSCSLLRPGDRLRLLAAVLRYELVDSLPVLEKRTQARATEFWKHMVDAREADLEALFASDSD